MALRTGDQFTLGPGSRGLVVAAFGIAGLLSGARLGRLADRYGVPAFGVSALLVFAGAVLAAGLAPAAVLVVVMVATAGATSTAGRVVVNALAIRSTPANRGGASSMTLAWQFLGSALAPVILLPIYHASPLASFATAAAVILPAAALLLRTPVLSTPANGRR